MFINLQTNGLHYDLPISLGLGAQPSHAPVSHALLLSPDFQTASPSTFKLYFEKSDSMYERKHSVFTFLSLTQTTSLRVMSSSSIISYMKHHFILHYDIIKIHCVYLLLLKFTYFWWTSRSIHNLTHDKNLMFLILSP